jgi:hypothetical protein
MKTLLIIALSFSLSLFMPVKAIAGEKMGNEQLVKEITELVKNEYPKFIHADPQEVTVHFQINAKNELVIFDTTGKDEDTCDKVKEVLNFKQIKFDQATPMKPYVVQIRFTK